MDENQSLESGILDACNDRADQCSNDIRERLFSLSVKAADLLVPTVTYHRDCYNHCQWEGTPRACTEDLSKIPINQWSPTFPTVRVTVQSICHMGLYPTAGTLPRTWWTSHVAFSLDQYGIIRYGYLVGTTSTWFPVLFVIIINNTKLYWIW